MNTSTLKLRIRAFWQKLLRIDARPDQIAVGFSIGIVASFVPLNPSPIIVAATVAWLLKRNVVAAVAGGTAAIVYMPLLPLIWLAEYRLGKLIFPYNIIWCWVRRGCGRFCKKVGIFTRPCSWARSSLPPQ